MARQTERPADLAEAFDPAMLLAAHCPNFHRVINWKSSIRLAIPGATPGIVSGPVAPFCLYTARISSGSYTTENW